MKNLFITMLFVATFISLQSCKDDETNPTPEANKVQLSNDSTFGKILTDSEGKSLYLFADDADGTSACINGCLNNWPIFYEANLTLDEGLDVNNFETITRADGEKQTTYKGWPLYYYITDTNAGDIFGDGVNGDWFIAKSDYSVMYVFNQLTGHDGNNYTSDYTQGDGETGYIVDDRGNTLYTFKNDVNNTNNFTAADFGNNAIWPIAEISPDKVPSNLDASDFGTIDVYGKTQLTYKGWPLYYFGQDLNRGDNKGISFPAPGGIWPVANTETTVAP